MDVNKRGGGEMTDREILELLVSKFESMETKIVSIEKDLSGIKKDLTGVKEQTAILTEFRDETNERFDRLENKLDEIEAKNAERHVAINLNVISIKRDLSRIEVNTAENWRDIARIKAMSIAEQGDYIL